MAGNEEMVALHQGRGHYLMMTRQELDRADPAGIVRFANGRRQPPTLERTDPAWLEQFRKARNRGISR
jgi:hypothetical protein